METNRIDLALALISKGSQAKSVDSGSSGTFANLLFDATGANQRHMKSMETYAPRRRFDDYQTQQIDFRQNSVTNFDRRDAGRKPRASWNTESATTISHNGADRPEYIAHQAPINHSVSQGSATSGDINNVAADNAIDSVSHTEAPKSEWEAPIDGEDCGKQSGDDDTNDSDASLIASMAPKTVADEASMTSEFDLFVIPATHPIKTEEVALAGASSQEIATAVAAAATATLPIGIGLPNEANDVAALPANEISDKGAATRAVSQSVTFSTILALKDTGEDAAGQADGQINTIAARSEKKIDDAASSFRRNTDGQRRNQANGTGTASQQATVAQHSAVTTTTTGAYSSGTTTTADATVTSALIPMGFDSGLGSTTGFQAWNLHLGQGSASRRDEFVANLRQHLQNLPAHEQVALNIQRSVRDGNGSITLQLSPSELGRIHLKLSIDEENNVQASIVVERPATLELLQRDMKSLERALQDAGLKAGPGDLSFSLQGGDPESFASELGSRNGNNSRRGGPSNGDDISEEETIAGRISIVDTADGLVDVQI